MTNILFVYIVNIIFFKKCFMNEQKYILLPFSFEKEKEYSSQSYNSNIFIKNNFYKNITFDFYIGNPPQKVNGVIINDNLCLELKKEEDLYSYNNFFNYINNKYKPKNSYTFSVSNKELRWTKGQYMTLGTELFKFANSNERYNLTFLLQKTEQENLDINNIENQNYIIKFGINALTAFSGDECPNFISSIRNKAKLNKYLISYTFINSNNGYLVIGDELYNYNPKRFHETQYKSVYATQNYYMINHHKEILIDIYNNKNITLNLTYAFLQYDLGVIIGTNIYRNIIDEIFFNKLIREGNCEINIVDLNNTNKYYLYSCNEKNFDLKIFPTIQFFSRSYEFFFELNYKDLFVKKYDKKYYFLVLFKVNNDTNNDTNIKDIWIMGEPFYRKYNFTSNIDARMLGFYNPNLEFEEEIIEKSGNNKQTLKIILAVVGVVIIIFLMSFCFFLGMQLKKGRKQRANELKEDNYDYFPENENEKEKNKLIN